MFRRTTERYYILNPKDIYYLTFTLEAYEGLASVTTIDKKAGIVKIQIAPGWEFEIDTVIENEPDLNIKEIKFIEGR